MQVAAEGGHGVENDFIVHIFHANKKGKKFF